MTKEQFDAQKCGAGMKVRYTCNYRRKEPSITEYDIVSVNFAERLIAVDDGSTDICEHCGEDVQVLTWLSYENCEII